MKVLVTGSDGYIGSLLAPLLMERGHEVTGLDTGFYRNAWLYNAVRWSPATLTRDTRTVTVDDLAGYDAVVHLAELSNDPLGQLNPEITYRINHQGSVHLARTAKKAGVTRFIYSSSCSVYGVGGKEWKTEESEPEPQTAYAECKLMVERDVAQMADDDFSPTFLRNATAYGPSPRMRFDLVLNNLAGVAWTTGEIKMTSDGTPWRPLAHVLDICRAMACTLEAPRKIVHGETFNVGDSRENYQVRDIAEMVAGALAGCRLSFGRSDGDNRSYRVSFDKINERLPGFRCERDARQGACELIDLFRRIGMTPEMFQDRAYTRLKQLQYMIDSGQLDGEFFWKEVNGKAG